jgi:FkbM family methyltransferase
LSGEYDRWLTAFIPRCLRAGDTFVDVGANVGVFTVLAARVVGSKGTVLAIEPDERNLRFLRINVAMTYFDQVNVLAVAVWSSKGTLTLGHDGDFFGNTRRCESGPTFDVPTQTLDVLLQDHMRVDLLKVDVEGGEAHVLAGAPYSLSSGRVRRIIFEFLPGLLGDDWEDAAARLRELETSGWKFFLPRDSVGGVAAISVGDLESKGGFYAVLGVAP